MWSGWKLTKGRFESKFIVFSDQSGKKKKNTSKKENLIDLKIQIKEKVVSFMCFKNYMETEIVDPAYMKSYRFFCFAKTRNHHIMCFYARIISNPTLSYISEDGTWHLRTSFMKHSLASILALLDLDSSLILSAHYFVTYCLKQT